MTDKLKLSEWYSALDDCQVWYGDHRRSERRDNKRWHDFLKGSICAVDMVVSDRIIATSVSATATIKPSNGHSCLNKLATFTTSVNTVFVTMTREHLEAQTSRNVRQF